MCRQSATVCLVKQPSRQQRDLPDRAARLDALPDPRGRRGRRHTLTSVLLTAACAVLAGARSYLAIGQWARHAPQDTLARLGFHACGPLGVRRPASPSTLRRVLVLVCPGGLADLLGHAPAGAQAVAVDGKNARGSRTDATPAAHLLSAVTAGRTVSQLRVPDKTNEITAFAALLAPFDLVGTVVTADALHTQREHAKWLVEVKKAHYLLVVKGNQCATRRSDTSPLQAGQTRREVCWVRWLTWIRKVKGTRACQETGDRAQVPGTVRRGTRVVWRKLDCLNPNLRRQQFTATGTAPETGARRDRGRTGSPWSTFAAGAMPNEGIEGDEWGAWAALIVCQRRTWDHRPSTAGGDGVPVVVAGVTPGRGERESRSQGEGAQVVRTPATPGRYAKCRALTQCSVS